MRGALWERREPGGQDMPEFVIERNMPGAGALSPEQLKGASQTSCSVLREMGPDIQWVQSYVTDDKIYCIYRAPDEAMIREHAERGGFPANSVSRVRAMIDPTTAE
jgi:predicted Rdx family selenoprotein